MDPKKKAKLGTRWTCYSCAGHFYDLNKPDPICPRCEADQRESPEVEKPKRKKAARKKAKKKKPSINPALMKEEEEVRPAEAAEGEIKELDLANSDQIQLEVQED